MQSSNPLQPAFKIRVYTSLKGEELKKNNMLEAHEYLASSNIPFTSSESFIDVEPFTKGEVVYSEEASRINTLSFNIDKYADILLYYFHIGTNVEFYGGTYQEGSPLKKIFAGSVTRIVTNFDDNGRVSFSVMCMAFGFVKLGKSEESFTYPDEKSSRIWARKPSLSVADIVKGICAEGNVDETDIDIEENYAKIRYTKRNQIRQNNQSDWAFLNKLASLTGCTVWTTIEKGKDVVHFRSPHKALEMQGEISFVYPLSGDYRKIESIPESAIIRTENPAYNRPRMLFDLKVEEDVALADSITRSAVYINKETGESEEVMAEYEIKDGKRFIIFYELDEEKVKKVEDEHPEFARAFRHSSPTSLKWSDKKDAYKDYRTLNYYYKVKKKMDESVAMFDNGFFGVYVTAKCPLDLQITSQRSYRLFGILRYRTKSTDETYYLRSLKHIWSSDGAWTDLDFML